MLFFWSNTTPTPPFTQNRMTYFTNPGMNVMPLGNTPPLHFSIWVNQGTQHGRSAKF